MQINSATTAASHPLSSTAAMSAQPPSFSCESTRMVGVTPSRMDESGFRSLDEKITRFNGGDINLLVSIIPKKFDRDVFVENMATRFDNANDPLKANNAKCNFSTSLLYPSSQASLYWAFDTPLMQLARQSGELELRKFPTEIANALASTCDQIKTIEQEIATLHEEYFRSISVSGISTALDMQFAAEKNDLLQRKKSIYQTALGHFQGFVYTTELAFGYIANDRSELKNALTKAGCTMNKEFVRIPGFALENRHKCFAGRIGEPPRFVDNQDKSAKINAKGEVVPRTWLETLAALRKHIEKHGNTAKTEVLITPVDKDPKDFVDAFFINLHSQDEPLELAEVNLFLRYNQASVHTFRNQAKDFPLLVLYKDKHEQRNKFAYVTFDAEGVPVASLTVPADQE